MNTSTNYITNIDTKASMRNETRRPTKLGECLHCDKQTFACKMKTNCIYQDNLRFCGLPGVENER